MPLWRVLLHGENLLMTIEGSTAKFGFYTTRWMRAANAEAATAAATELVTAELRSRTLNAEDDPMTVRLHSIAKLWWPIHRRGVGFAFYPIDENWQRAAEEPEQ
jgi:hypothetical protein